MNDENLELWIDEDGPKPFAIWTTGDSADIIGTGHTLDEAMADAAATLAAWAGGDQ